MNLYVDDLRHAVSIGDSSPNFQLAEVDPSVSVVFDSKPALVGGKRSPVLDTGITDKKFVPRAYFL